MSDHSLAPALSLDKPSHDLSPAVPLSRSANILVGHLGALGVDVEVRSEPDGRVAVVLPAAWASLYLASLQAQAAQLHAQLRKADEVARIREIERRAASGEALRKWEAEQAILYADYQEFIAKGASHREALHKLQRQVGERLNVTDLEEIVRAQRVGERRRAREECRQRVRALRAQGRSRKAIAEELGLTLSQVMYALCRRSKSGGKRSVTTDLLA